MNPQFFLLAPFSFLLLGCQYVIGVDDATPREAWGVAWDFADADDANEWVAKPPGACHAECVEAFSLVHHGDVLRVTVPFDARANSKAQTAVFGAAIPLEGADLTGAVPSIRIRHVSGGYGSDAVGGGFDVYLFVYDENYSIEDEAVGSFFFGQEPNTTYTWRYQEPLAVDGPFDPSVVVAVDVRIDTKFWQNMTFDYSEAVFEIERIAIEGS